ncbi:aldehyde dehydrogenase (NADP(+)) [Glycomyces algeriensis]|uniref:Aldehyde dehydrogenase n=1 Tax=Glycomyces algeriensis TaxID=256037 RepID=A0A9W6G938_9ACTN|nr:aldehyde dehydrogenase (NADP(+)) [Glycomyces algeriensis]MDA1368838.1 aldehyde dehydrogenase (NADP(+)) [Glycomyces algeriensis]MDR7350854.1 NADP-dependent aldehyde dehydrogenase [Glycomyces algeriensis]GLI43565.1 aldehyde dehydrogenase [Glycomyces algeriensis]
MADTLRSVNPTTGEAFGEPIAQTTPEEVARLAAAARAAAPGLAALRPAERGAIMHTIAAALTEHEDAVVALADAESGLGETRLRGELARTTGQFEQYAAYAEHGGVLDVVIDHAAPRATPPRPDLRRWNTPLGPVAVYAASNFPLGFGVAGTDTAAALAAGCPVVAKAHASQPALAVLLGKIIAAALERHGADPRLFAVVSGFQAGLDLIRDPNIKAGAFTGSIAGGRALADEAAGRPEPIPFYGELGSLNPVVVTPEAVAQRGRGLVEEFVASMTLGAGQFCTKPGLLFLPEGHGLDEALAAAVRAKEVHPMLNGRIQEAYAAEAAGLASHPQARFAVEPSTAGGGFAVTPGLIAAPAAAIDGDDTLLHECFGPTALVLTYADTAELERVLPQLPGGLTATVQLATSADPVAQAALPLLAERSGRVIVNGWPTGVAVTHAQHHGGPWPATLNARYTSVGTGAIARFVRPVAYQSTPEPLLPEALHYDNPLGLQRRVDGVLEPAPKS